MLSRLKKLVKQKQVSTEKHSDFICNVFNTHFDKQALLSLVTFPFTRTDKFFFHTIEKETQTIANCLKELGYNIDVVNYDQHLPAELGSRKYNLLVGYGQSIEDYIVRFPTKDYKIILYRNGCDASYMDKITLDRAKYFYDLRGFIPVNSLVLYPRSFKYQVKFADRIIVLGNEFVAKTFAGQTDGEICSLKLFYFPVPNLNMTQAKSVDYRKNFLWFGSRGAVHKGLDILLDVFFRRADINLFIGGLNEAEAEFKTHFAHHLNRANVFNLGFVKMESEEFRLLMEKIGYVIFPTIGEGGGGSVLNVVGNSQVLPVVPRELGVDMNGHEVLIEQISPVAVEAAIDKALALDETTYLELSAKASNYIRSNHKHSEYSKSLLNLMTIDNSILNKPV